MGVRLSAGEAHAGRVVDRADARPDGVHLLRAGRVDLRQRGVVHGGQRARSACRPRCRLLAMLCFALSPLTQLLHCDRHDRPPLRRAHVRAAQRFGSACVGSSGSTAHRAPSPWERRWGSRCAFHNGLFILQLVPLAAVFVLWLRNAAPPLAALRAFAIALLVTTQLILLPSEPYRRLHVRVRAVVVVSLLRRRLHERRRSASWRGGRSRAAISRCSALLCALLAMPLGAQLVAGAGFLSGSFSILDQIVEVQSPYALVTNRSAPVRDCRLLQLAAACRTAATRVLCVSRLSRARARAPLLRRRGHVRLGAAAQSVPAALLRLLRPGDGRSVVARSACERAYAGTAGRRSSQRSRPSLSPISRRCANGCSCSTHRAATPSTGTILSLLLELQRLCAEDPGVVLASTDDGNGVLFHSECSVIANNFILRPEDARHIDEIYRLMRLDPGRDTATTARREVRARCAPRTSSRSRTTPWCWPRVTRSRMQLLARSTPPPGFEIVATVHWRLDDQGTKAVFARLFKIVPDSATPEG